LIGRFGLVMVSRHRPRPAGLEDGESTQRIGQHDAWVIDQFLEFGRGCRTLVVGEQPEGYDVGDAHHHVLMRILVAARTFAEAEEVDGADLIAETGGDRTLKGFSRAIPTYLITGRRGEPADAPAAAEGAAP